MDFYYLYEIIKSPYLQKIILLKLIYYKNIQIPFYFLQDIVFNKNFLPFHANGLTFTAFLEEEKEYTATFYSIGGGFVVKEERVNAQKKLAIKCAFPFPIQKKYHLLIPQQFGLLFF